MIGLLQRPGGTGEVMQSCLGGTACLGEDLFGVEMRRRPAGQNSAKLARYPRFGFLVCRPRSPGGLERFDGAADRPFSVPETLFQRQTAA